MKSRTLQEVAKFASGLIAADFFSVLWFSQQGALPMRSMGMTFTPEMVWPALIFDIAVFLILVHYGWHVGKLPRMRERAYLFIAGVIFTIVALAHLVRLFGGFDLQLDGWLVPLWLSWVGVAVCAYLAYSSFHFAARMPRR